MADLLLSLSLLGVVSLVFREVYRGVWLRLAHGGVYAALLWIAHPMLLETSKKTLDIYLSSASVQTDLLLLLSVDLMLHAASISHWNHQAAVGARRNHAPWDLTERITRAACRIAYYVPPLWPAASLVYIRLALLYAWPGVSFSGVTAGLMALALALCSLAPWPLRGLKGRPEISYAPMASAILAFLLAQLVAPSAMRLTLTPKQTDYTQLLGSLYLIAALIPITAAAYWLHLRKSSKHK